MRILVTRSQPNATKTAAALRTRGHEPIVAPLLEMELIAEVDAKDGPWTAILLTSANGLWGIASWARNIKWHGIPVFAVGDMTAKAARDMGFSDVTSPGGNIDALAKLVTTRLKPPGRLLYLAGEERAGDLAGALRAKGFEIDLVVVYRFVVTHDLPDPAVAALAGEIGGVLHFSRHSATTFLDAARNSNLLDAALNKPVHFCLSEQVAAPLRAAGAANIKVAARPTADALLELCG